MNNSTKDDQAASQAMLYSIREMLDANTKTSQSILHKSARIMGSPRMLR